MYLGNDEIDSLLVHPLVRRRDRDAARAQLQRRPRNLQPGEVHAGARSYDAVVCG